MVDIGTAKQALPPDSECPGQRLMTKCIGSTLSFEEVAASRLLAATCFSGCSQNLLLAVAAQFKIRLTEPGAAA